MHGPAYGLVAAQAEGDVGDAAADPGKGKRRLDAPRRLEIGDRVVVVVVDPRRHREDVGVEDDVFRRETDFVHQDAVGAGADLHHAVGGVGLADFVEGHDHHGGAVAQTQARQFAEPVLALLHGDRIDDALALNDLQARLDHLPLGAVDHDRDAGDVGLGGHEVQEGDHGLFGIEKALVHVDVDDRGAGLDLLTRDVQGGVVIALDDQLLEFRRAGDVGAFADVDEDRTGHLGSVGGLMRPGRPSMERALRS